MGYMIYRDKFEEETRIPEDYDPNETRESGFYSTEYKDKYIAWLENKVKSSLKDK